MEKIKSFQTSIAKKVKGWQVTAIVCMKDGSDGELYFPTLYESKREALEALQRALDRLEK